MRRLISGRQRHQRAPERVVVGRQVLVEALEHLAQLAVTLRSIYGAQPFGDRRQLVDEAELARHALARPRYHHCHGQVRIGWCRHVASMQ